MPPSIGNFVLGERGEEASGRPAFLVGLRGELAARYCESA